MHAIFGVCSTPDYDWCAKNLVWYAHSIFYSAVSSKFVSSYLNLTLFVITTKLLQLLGRAKMYSLSRKTTLNSIALL